VRRIRAERSWPVVRNCRLDGARSIEKKPLAGFYPVSMILSVAVMAVTVLQILPEPRISQADIRRWSRRATFLAGGTSGGVSAYCARAISASLYLQRPFISWEFVHDAAVLIRAAGMKNVLVTNGYVNPERLRNCFRISTR
jgi:pyruvate formate lyase activating enzyme